METRDKMDIHHLVGQSKKKHYNVGIKENQRLIDKKQHQAINTLFGHSQTPKEQLAILFDMWFTVLSRGVRDRLVDILSIDDRGFYIDKIYKK